MKTMRLFWLLCLSANALVVSSRAAAAKSDLVSPEARHSTLVVAARLAQPTKVAVISEELKTPFNPAGFDRADSEEQKALAATVAAVTGNIAKIRTPREILDTIAPRIQPSGAGSVRGNPYLYYLGKTYRVGDKFIVTDEGSDYEVTLVAIGSNDFRLRYRNEETTRPITKKK